MAAKVTTTAPDFQEMVREFGPITLGEARRYAATLPPEQQGLTNCVCYKVRFACCPGCVAGCACPINCCCCVWTPASLYLLDFLTGLFFCVCSEGSGQYSCSDMKGNSYHLFKVDGETGTLAWFSDNEACSKGDNLKVSVYCERCC